MEDVPVGREFFDAAKTADPMRDMHDEATPGPQIEDLLIAGLDRYFAGRHEEAIHIWTRVLFIDRGHRRAHRDGEGGDRPGCQTGRRRSGHGAIRRGSVPRVLIGAGFDRRQALLDQGTLPFVGREGGKLWEQLVDTIAERWDDVIDALDDLVTTPRVDMTALAASLPMAGPMISVQTVVQLAENADDDAGDAAVAGSSWGTALTEAEALHEWALEAPAEQAQIVLPRLGGDAPLLLAAILAPFPTVALLATPTQGASVAVTTGEGPDANTRERGSFEVRLVGQGDGFRVEGRFAGKGDPGYGATSVMLAESSVTSRTPGGSGLRIGLRFGPGSPRSRTGAPHGRMDFASRPAARGGGAQEGPARRPLLARPPRHRAQI